DRTRRLCLRRNGRTVEWPRGEAAACKAVHTGSNPVSTSTRAIGAEVARFLDTEEVTGSIPVSPTSTDGPPGDPGGPSAYRDRLRPSGAVGACRALPTRARSERPHVLLRPLDALPATSRRPGARRRAGLGAVDDVRAP